MSMFITLKSIIMFLESKNINSFLIKTFMETKLRNTIFYVIKTQKFGQCSVLFKSNNKEYICKYFISLVVHKIARQIFSLTYL